MEAWSPAAERKQVRITIETRAHNISIDSGILEEVTVRRNVYSALERPSYTLEDVDAPCC